MHSDYDTLGFGYTNTRQPDPVIASQIERHLSGASQLINIGAGTGSYEPENIPVVAVEPSITMIRQRPNGAAPVIQAVAEALPFADAAFPMALSVLSVHHWQNRRAAFSEIRRIVTDRAAIVTWVPGAAEFWLTRDYFPDLLAIDEPKFPALAEFQQSFEKIKVIPLLIPHDCTDGFLGAYWRRPHCYLDEKIRAGMSTFAELPNPEQGLARLAEDLKAGLWHKRNAAILDATVLDLGYRLVIADFNRDSPNIN